MSKPAQVELETTDQQTHIIRKAVICTMNR